MFARFYSCRLGKLMGKKSAQDHDYDAQDQLLDLVRGYVLIGAQTEPEREISAARNQAGDKGPQKPEAGGRRDHGQEQYIVITARNPIGLANEQVTKDELHRVGNDAAFDRAQRQLRLEDLKDAQGTEKRDRKRIPVGTEDYQTGEERYPYQILWTD